MVSKWEFKIVIFVSTSQVDTVTSDFWRYVKRMPQILSDQFWKKTEYLESMEAPDPSVVVGVIKFI